MEHRRIITQGAVVVATHEDGSIDPAGTFTHGLFVGDTRFLSHFRLYLDGESPDLMGSDVTATRRKPTAFSPPWWTPPATLSTGAGRRSTPGCPETWSPCWAGSRMPPAGLVGGLALPLDPELDRDFPQTVFQGGGHGSLASRGDRAAQCVGCRRRGQSSEPDALPGERGQSAAGRRQPRWAADHAPPGRSRSFRLGTPANLMMQRWGGTSH